MLETPRHIVQQANAAPDLPSALAIAVSQIRDTLRVSACTIYLAGHDHREWVLVATAGLNPAAIGQARLSYQQGLVGLVAERQEPLSLQDARRHPRFQITPNAGEESCHAFMGVPLIQDRQTLGVLVIQDARIRQFETEERDFLVTIAARLIGILRRADLSGGAQDLLNPRAFGTRPLLGLAGAQGVAIGTITIPYQLTDLDDVPDRPTSDPVAEETSFRAAIAAIDEELRLASEQLAPLAPPTEQALFAAHRMLLHSDSLLDETSARIRAGSWGPAAWSAAVLARARLLEQTDDSYLRARAKDIRDLGRRVLGHLRGGAAQILAALPDRCVLLAQEMSVGQLAAVPPERLAAIVCLRGSTSSHVAILARAMGIPAVMNLGDQPISRFEGQDIIVDGYEGRVFVNPDSAVRAEYQQRLATEAELIAGLGKLRDLPAETLDGYRLPLYTKAGLLSDIPSASACGADGLGLYRTEFAFMIRESFPTEEEQFALYRQVLAAFFPQPVVIRTLDIGGDKSLPYFTINEANPFLGWRGIRFSLDQPGIFLTQLRALLRANAGLGNLRILFPMITTAQEIDEALRLLDQAYRDLAEDGQPAERPQVGVMIEVPSAAWQAAQLAGQVDFLSVGTNDLTQYLLAVDRDNARVARLYDNLHPAMLKMIAHVLAGGQHAGRPVNVSGEMATDPGAAVLLLGMGAASLNASPASLPRVKWAIRSVTRAQARRLAEQALALDTVNQIRQLINDVLRQVGLSEIVRETS